MDFSKNQVSNFIIIRLVGAEYFHADRVTDMRKPHAHKNGN